MKKRAAISPWVLIVIMLIIAFAFFTYKSQRAVSPTLIEAKAAAEAKQAQEAQKIPESAAVSETIPSPTEPEDSIEQPAITPNSTEPTAIVEQPINSSAPAENEPNTMPANEFTVKIGRGKFEPKELSVPVGSTVVWKNSDTIVHGVSAKDKSFYRGRLTPGQEYRHTFNKTGTNAYFDVLFVWNQGKIIVS